MTKSLNKTKMSTSGTAAYHIGRISQEGFTGLQAEKDIDTLRDAINYLEDAISEILEVATV